MNRLLLAAVLLVCCAPEPAPWYDQLQPDSPCYRVDLVDGLDEQQTTEVQDLFACVNHWGHVEPLAPTAAAMESPSSDGVPAAIELARAANALPDANVDALTLLTAAVGVIEVDDDTTTHLQDVLLELTYGTHHVYVRRDGYDLTDPDALGGGALAPLAPVVPTLAQGLLDDDLQTAAFAGDVLQDPATHRWIWTMASWAAATHPDVQEPLDDLLPDLGQALVDTRSPANDRWRGASGDSLRDLLDVAVTERGGRDLLDDVAPELASMLGDSTVRSALPDELVRLQGQRHLGQAIPQLTWMAQIDTRGGNLQPGEDSALTAMVRLLHATNRPMRCRLDLLITEVDVDLGNLATGLLRVLADQDPDAVQDVAGLFGDLLGYGLSDGVLRNLADTEACPVLTPQVVDDLYSLDRLSEPQARALTHTLIGLLRVLRDGEQDHIGEVVDVISTAWTAGLTPPLEEVLRDVGESNVSEDLVALVPVMDRPERYGVSAQGEPAATLEDLLQVVAWTVQVEDGRTGWRRLRPLVVPVLEHDSTWLAMGHVAPVLADRQSALAHAEDLLPPLIEADPELQILQELAPLLGDRAVAAPLLRLVATRPVVDAALATRGDADHPEVPLAFLGRLVRSGTLDDLLSMVRIVVRDLRHVTRPEDEQG